VPFDSQLLFNCISPGVLGVFNWTVIYLQLIGPIITTGRHENTERVVASGYPAALARATERRRSVWYRDYADTLIQHDNLHANGLIKAQAIDPLGDFRIGLFDVFAQVCEIFQDGGFRTALGDVGDAVSSATYFGVVSMACLI
jgi:hypothetical protein